MERECMRESLNYVVENYFQTNNERYLIKLVPCKEINADNVDVFSKTAIGTLKEMYHKFTYPRPRQTPCCHLNKRLLKRATKNLFKLYMMFGRSCDTIDRCFHELQQSNLRLIRQDQFTKTAMVVIPIGFNLLC